MNKVCCIWTHTDLIFYCWQHNVTNTYEKLNLAPNQHHTAESFLRRQEFLGQSRNSPHFTEPDGPLPHSQTPANCSYPELDQYSPWRTILVLSCRLRLDLPSGLFPVGLPHQNPVCACFTSFRLKRGLRIYNVSSVPTSAVRQQTRPLGGTTPMAWTRFAPTTQA